MSSLEFFEAAGLPVYRMKKQMRIARGLFDIEANTIYPEVPYKYGRSCAINLPQFEVGRQLEAFIQERFKGDKHLKAPASDELTPLFIHCEGSYVHKDAVTHKMRSDDQVNVALDFALDFVRSRKVDPTRITFIAPYAANVDLINRAIKKKPKYAEHLRDCPSAATVDSFQGQ